MSKCDITVSKKFTLNTGNFSSVQPSISITVHDIVDEADLPKVHRLLDILTDGLLHKQIESDAKTMDTIKRLGFDEYFKTINKDKMDEIIKKAVEKLRELPPF